MKTRFIIPAVLLLTSCASSGRKPAADASGAPQEAAIESIKGQIKNATLPAFGPYQNLEMRFNFDQTWRIALLGSDHPDYTGHLPGYHVSVAELGSALEKDARETLTTRTPVSATDFRRLLHPNGICLRGTWKMDTYADPTYTGYFKPGTTAPLIARASSAGANIMVNSEHYNSFGFVGRIFSNDTADTADFITQTDIGGVEAKSFFQADTLNTPPVSPLNRKQMLVDIEVTKLLLTGHAFDKVDSNNSNRQMYAIAELGKGEEATQAPHFMKFAFSKMGVPFPNGPMDFRNEVLSHLPFTVEVQVSEAEGKSAPFLLKGTPLDMGTKVDPNSKSWRRIGEATFDAAVTSWACDFRLHFHHSPWRDDLNKPGTEKPDLRPDSAKP